MRNFVKKLIAVGVFAVWLIFLFSIVADAKAPEPKESFLSDEIKALCYEYGGLYEIDPYLVMAFCEIESSGRADVISANGQYYGLMQLNKDTFKGDLLDAENNVSQGVEYLNRLSADNDGNIARAVSLYSGEGGNIGYYTNKVLRRWVELKIFYLPRREIEQMEVGTVCIALDEYKELLIENEKMKMELDEKYEKISNLAQMLNKTVGAVETYVRENSKYGEYPYLDSATRKLLKAIGYADPKDFDLTVGKEDAKEEED